MNAALSVEELSVFHGDTQALWNVSFGVQSGQLVALFGANGAGKTTTLKAICGLLAASRRPDHLRGPHHQRAAGA